MAADISSLIIVLLLGVLWLIVRRAGRYHIQLNHSSATTIRQRLLKPRTPGDCPACRSQPVLPPSAPALPPAIRPWSEVKSLRGAPKRITTDGFACPNRAGAPFLSSG